MPIPFSDMHVFSSLVLVSKDHHRPYVDFPTSMLDGFCDGSKDFLKLSQLLSKFHLVDHSKNTQECLNRIHAMHATYGGTYGNKNSGPHLDAPLDPKSLMLIETRALHLA